MTPPVADTSPILVFARAGRLELLRIVIPQLIVPPTVYEELTVKDGYPGVAEVKQGRGTWIVVQPLTDPTILTRVKLLDPGEREAIALELGRDILMDERAGRIEARHLGVPLQSTLSVLEVALLDGLIPRVKPELDHLINAGFRLSKMLYQRFLQDLGEMP